MKSIDNEIIIVKNARGPGYLKPHGYLHSEVIILILRGPFETYEAAQNSTWTNKCVTKWVYELKTKKCRPIRKDEPGAERPRDDWEDPAGWWDLVDFGYEGLVARNE